MAAVKLFRGDTWQRGWVFKNKLTQQPIDLTGATARLYVRNNAKSLIYAASTANGDIVVEPLSGALALTVAAASTATWAAGSYRFDLEVTYPDGVVATYESNVVAVMEDQSYG